MRLILAFVLLWNFSAFAAERFSVYGLGTNSCGKYLADRQNDGNKFDTVVAAQYSDWVRGFISGYNAGTTGKQVATEELSRPTIVAYLDKYCRDNPLNYVMSGVTCLRANYAGPKPEYCK